MLVLTRKSQEAVVVGGLDGDGRILKIIVLEVRGGKVKLGFELDAAVPSTGWKFGNEFAPATSRRAYLDLCW